MQAGPRPRLLRWGSLGMATAGSPNAASPRGPSLVLDYVLRVARLVRLGVAPAVQDVGGGQQVEPRKMAAPPAAPSAGGAGAGGRAPEHLLVLVNGLFGSRANWEVLQGLIAAELGAGALLHASQSNEFAQVRWAPGSQRRAERRVV